MSKAIDITGQRFERLVALEPTMERSGSYIKWLCRCNCGKMTKVDFYKLKSGHTKSCGCLNRDMIIKYSTTHNKRYTSTYYSWRAMKSRCLNPNRWDYKHYGGRGITVCKRWLKFESFYRDMGDKPKGLTLERLDNEKSYYPNNCEWQTQKAQNNNSRNNIFIHYGSQNLTIAQWAEKIGLKYTTLWQRIKKLNWPIRKALTEKVKNYG